MLKHSVIITYQNYILILGSSLEYLHYETYEFLCPQKNYQHQGLAREARVAPTK